MSPGKMWNFQALKVLQNKHGPGSPGIYENPV